MKTIFDLKSDAHMLIDEILSYGVPKNRVYKMLRYRLQVPYGMEHISKMATMTQVERAIDVLKSMRNYEERRFQKSGIIHDKPSCPKPPSLPVLLNGCENVPTSLPVPSSASFLKTARQSLLQHLKSIKTEPLASPPLVNSPIKSPMQGSKTHATESISTEPKRSLSWDTTANALELDSIASLSNLGERSRYPRKGRRSPKREQAS